jgi:hypothetical protein
MTNRKKKKKERASLTFVEDRCALQSTAEKASAKELDWRMLTSPH